MKSKRASLNGPQGPSLFALCFQATDGALSYAEVKNVLEKAWIKALGFEGFWWICGVLAM